MMSSRVIEFQPEGNVWDYEHEWTYELCNMCTNSKRCLCAFLCTLCFEFKLFKRMSQCGCQAFVPGSLIALRSTMRTGFRIKGSICSDCMATTFCPCCALIQMDGELDDQERR